MDRLGPYLLGYNEEPECGIYTGDARNLARAIPDESVDLIFTDPPYGREFLSLYAWVAQIASRILRPGGFCLVMCGGIALDQIFSYFGVDGLQYFWKYELWLGGQQTGKVHPQGSPMPIITRCKPVLAYSKGRGRPQTVTYSPFQGDAPDKNHHEWGQGARGTRYFVEGFSAEDGIVLDPFMGGGTTAFVCRQFGRRYLGFELGAEVAQQARARVRGIFPHPAAGVQLPLFPDNRAPGA